MNYKYIILCLLLYILGFFTHYLTSSTDDPEPPIIIDNTFKIDSLNNKINEHKHTQDSLQVLLDSLYNNVKYIDRWYEKEIAYINDNTVESDIEFFSNYLSKINSSQ